MKITAEELYDKLINEDKILTAEGRITFNFLDIEYNVKKKDIIGNVLEEWLSEWLKEKGYEYEVERTQESPDIYLDPNDKKRNLLEVKSFYRKKSPGFDIADFKAYMDECIQRSYMLDADYIIFGYDMDETTGIVTVKELWLKKVWQICGSSADWPVKVQYKNQRVDKIRPVVWYSTRSTFKPFECLEDFLSALLQTIWQNPRTKEASGTWQGKVKRSYKNFYGKDIIIPKWDDIESKYR